MLKPTQKWLNSEELKNIYSSEYWNNLEEEKDKPWYILNGDYSQCLNYLKETGLIDEFEFAEKVIDKINGTNLVVADLAAGIGWTSALLSKKENISEVHAVEISEHRVEELFEHSIKMMKGNEEKVFRYVGSFYDLKFKPNSIDIVFLSQAFHHADRPFNLLVEIDRVLKPGGIVILIGEHYFSTFKIIRGFIRNLLKKGKITFNFRKIFPTDHDLGDHYFSIAQYDFLFHHIGYSLDMKKAKTGNAIYFATKL
jgi:ubiquinone/menaquinone biosynthesis C-methylase UbiE